MGSIEPYLALPCGMSLDKLIAENSAFPQEALLGTLG